jgi:ribosomal protein S12 methylthiotransferase
VAAVHAAVPPLPDPFVDLVPAPSGPAPDAPALRVCEDFRGLQSHSCSFCIIPGLRGRLVKAGPRASRAGARPSGWPKAGVQRASGHQPGHQRPTGVDRKYAESSSWKGQPLIGGRISWTWPSALGDARRVGCGCTTSIPTRTCDEVIPLMAEAGKILPYLDIPFQHASSGRFARRMRAAGRAGPRRWTQLAGLAEAVCPDLAVRSTFIVGFPGETEADFQALLDWLEEARLSTALAAFKYEPMWKAPRANAFAGAMCTQEVKAERWASFHGKGAEGFRRGKLMAAKVGQQLRGDRRRVWMRKARSAAPSADAPEIDGHLFIDDGFETLRPGQRLWAEVEEASEYDLWGRALAAKPGA